MTPRLSQGLALAAALVLAACGQKAAEPAASTTGSPAASASSTSPVLTIKDHQFVPAELRVPAGKALEIQVANQDPLAEEFDSSDLKVEKVIAGGQTGTVRLRPLAPGRYTFQGEYHPATAKGVVVAQ